MEDARAAYLEARERLWPEDVEIKKLETIEAFSSGEHYQKCVIEATLWKKKKRASPRVAAPRPKGCRPR